MASVKQLNMSRWENRVKKHTLLLYGQLCHKRLKVQGTCDGWASFRLPPSLLPPNDANHNNEAGSRDKYNNRSKLSKRFTSQTALLKSRSWWLNATWDTSGCVKVTTILLNLGNHFILDDLPEKRVRSGWLVHMLIWYSYRARSEQNHTLFISRIGSRFAQIISSHQQILFPPTEKYNPRAEWKKNCTYIRLKTHGFHFIKKIHRILRPLTFHATSNKSMESVPYWSNSIQQHVFIHIPQQIRPANAQPVASPSSIPSSNRGRVSRKLWLWTKATSPKKLPKAILTAWSG